MAKMNKQFMFVFAVLAATVILAGLATAGTSDEIAQNGEISVWIGNIPIVEGQTVPFSVFANERLPVRVGFTADDNAEDVRIEVEVRGYGDDIQARTERFDTIEGNFYTKLLSLDIPFDLEDQPNDVATVEVRIFSDDINDESEVDFDIDVQRESRLFRILSVDTDPKAFSGDYFPVDVVLKNVGMRDLENLFVTARIPALGVERSGFVGDLIAVDELSDDDDEEDSAFVRIFLQIPEDAKPGIYNLEVTANNKETISVADSVVKQVVIDSRFFGDNVVVPVTGKSFAVSETAMYEILLVNPTSALKIYTVVPEASGQITAAAEKSVVAVPAGSSASVKLLVRAAEQGTHTFGVSVFSEGELVKRVDLTANVKEGGATTTSNPVIALTIVLAIVFVVLLIVLIALLSRKPQKPEEFGESYY